jgi:hypothetical protein
MTKLELMLGCLWALILLTGPILFWEWSDASPPNRPGFSESEDVRGDLGRESGRRGAGGSSGPAGTQPGLLLSRDRENSATTREARPEKAERLRTSSFSKARAGAVPNERSRRSAYSRTQADREIPGSRSLGLRGGQRAVRVGSRNFEVSASGSGFSREAESPEVSVGGWTTATDGSTGLRGGGGLESRDTGGTGDGGSREMRSQRPVLENAYAYSNEDYYCRTAREIREVCEGGGSHAERYEFCLSFTGYYTNGRHCGYLP